MYFAEPRSPQKVSQRTPPPIEHFEGEQDTNMMDY